MDETLQKEEFSKAYVRAICATAGFQATKPEVDDDCFDLTVSSPGGISAKLDIQLKCTSQEVMYHDGVHFTLELAHYNKLSKPETLVPRILIVVLIPVLTKDWLEQTDEKLILYKSAYWVSLKGYPESQNTASVTITLPKEQMFCVSSLREMIGKINKREDL